MAAYTILAGEGCAGRFATGRGVARSSLRSPSRTGPGSGCPLRPQVEGHGVGGVWRWGREQLDSGGLAGKRVSGQAAEGERGQEEEEGGHSEEEDVGGVDAHGELLRGSGGAGVWSEAWPGSGRGAGGLRSVRRLRCIRCLMCIRCLIRVNASRWLAKGISLRAKGHQPAGRGCMGTTCR
nr:MAG TPA: hypothetical protein [Caudoviricetes sp.]